MTKKAQRKTNKIMIKLYHVSLFLIFSVLISCENKNVKNSVFDNPSKIEEVTRKALINMVDDDYRQGLMLGFSNERMGLRQYKGFLLFCKSKSVHKYNEALYYRNWNHTQLRLKKDLIKYEIDKYLVPFLTNDRINNQLVLLDSIEFIVYSSYLEKIELYKKLKQDSIL